MAISGSRKAFPTGRVKRLHVARGETGWQVKQEGSSRSVGIYTSQAAATAAAKAALRKSGGELTVHGRDGRIRKSFTLGRDVMAKIAAVEGIRISQAMERMLDRLDRDGVSDDKRRRIIARQFGSKG